MASLTGSNRPAPISCLALAGGNGMTKRQAGPWRWAWQQAALGYNLRLDDSDVSGMGERNLKLVSYIDNGKTAVGAVLDGHYVVPLADVAPDMLALIEMGEDGLAAVDKLIARSPDDSLALNEVRLLAPIPEPRRNIMCLGKNYAAHAAESQRAWGEAPDLPQYPIFFTKATTAVNGPFDPIPYDQAVSSELDYEAELALIIGRGGRNILVEQAYDHIYGYTVMNDISARDLQRNHNQFFKGKSLDGSAPLGPWIVTRDEVSDPQNLKITCAVNGDLKQDSNTRLMIFNIAQTVAQLSRGMTLLPGDIIATGTPAGVGFARTPPEFLQPGDEVTCTVEHIGTIKNRVEAVS
jgi:2-keto-4-pentenoate hydratase/2-oxohepta-3-ene-1,7-dioic acid hydratase in catechol pathway